MTITINIITIGNSERLGADYLFNTVIAFYTFTNHSKYCEPKRLKTFDSRDS